MRKKPVPGPLSVLQKPSFASSFLSICISTVLTYVLYRKPGSCLCPPTVHLHRKLQSFPCTYTHSTHICTYCVYWSYGPVGCLPTVQDICGRKPESCPCVYLQSIQSAGPVRFLIFCSISIILLASLVAGRDPSVQQVQSSREGTPPYLSTGISNLLQPAQAEVVLGQLSTHLASWCLPAIYVNIKVVSSKN